MDFHVLGPVAARIDGRRLHLGGRKQRTVLGLLILDAARAVPFDVLVEGVWGEQATSGARSTLQSYIFNLRSVLGNRVVTDNGGYRLAVERDEIDAVRFEAAVERASGLAATRPAEASDLLRSALAMWSGSPYGDVAPSVPLQAEARRLEEVRLRALEDTVAAELALGHHSALLAELEVLTTEFPLSERFRAHQMVALYRAGRQSEALRAYERSRHDLMELGLDPWPRLRALEQQILEHDPDLDLQVAADVRAVALLMTDIEGAALMWDSRPDETARLLNRHHALIAEAVHDAGGRVVRRSGEGLWATLPGVEQAVTAAQRAHQALDGPGDAPVRMAIDAGEVELRGDDVSGPPVQRCSRLLSAGHGGQVLLSDDAQAALAASPGTGWKVKALGEHRFEGLGRHLNVFQLLVDGATDGFPPLRTGPPPAPTTWRHSVRGYELRRRVGGDIHGVVYRAYQPSVGREVAIRVTRPEHANQPDFVRRFEAEAHLVARLQHPHVVPLYDYWRDPDGAFVVTRWLDGGSLQNALSGGPWDVESALRLLEQVGDALAYAHRSDIVHGDLHPGNILLDEGGNAYLTGFRIAAAGGDGPRAGGHVAPEVGAGAPPTPRSDVYGLGLVAWALLTGSGSPGEPVRIAELARHLPGGAAIAQACAPEPSARHASVDELLMSLREARQVLPGDAGRADRAVRNPYKGLRAFQDADAADFHGRADLVDEITAAVATHRVVAVVGPSGIGKSSLVRAGLIPRLRAGGGDGLPWLVTDMIPGAYPFEELERALRRVAVRRPDGLIEDVAAGRDSLAQMARRVLPQGTRALLVIDQFEELFTLTADASERQRFVDALTALDRDDNPSLTVLVTLRSDHLDHPLRSPELGELLARATVMVAAPSRDDLVAAIVRPAAAVGVRFEPAVVERAVSEVGDEPGGLPLLQHALTEMFADRGGAVVTLADYESAGGVLGALGRRADAIYDGLDPAQRAAARQVLLRLVTVDESAGDTRRRVTLRELRSLPDHGASVDTVLDAFAAHRLLTFDRHPVTRAPTVEVAHEALLTRWNRLRAWIDDRREELLARRRLSEAVEEWERSGRDDDYLLTEARLARFETLADGDLTVSELEQAYLDAGREVADRRARVRRRARRLLVAGLAAGLVVTTALAGFALVSRQRATDAAATARARELATAAVSVLDVDPTLSKLLAVASVDVAHPTPESVGALHRAWAADSVVDRYPGPPRDLGPLHTDLHPGGDLLLATGWADFGVGANYLEVYDLSRDQVAWTFETDHPSARPGRAIFSPDGSKVVAGVQWTYDPEPTVPVPEALGVFVIDTETGDLLDRIDVGRCGGIVDAMSETHLLVKTLRDDESAATCNWFGKMAVDVVDVRTGEARTVGADGHNWSDGAVMSRDGRYVAFDDLSTGELNVVDLSNDETLLRIPSQTPRFVRAMSPDGSLIANGNDPIDIWDVHSGEVVASYEGHQSESYYVRFDASGESVYSTGGDGSLHVWEAATGTARAVVPHAGHLRPSATPDGRILVSRVDGTAALVDTRPRGEVAAIPTCPGTVLGDTLRVSGAYAILAVSCGSDAAATTFVLDLASGDVLYTLPGHGGLALTVSPDGTRFARQEGEGTMYGAVTIRDLATGAVLVELEGMCTWDSTLAWWMERPGCRTYPETPFQLLADRLRWSPDMTMIADTTVFNTVVWDAETGRLLYTEPTPVDDEAFDVLFTPDSERLVVSGNHTLRARSTATWETELAVANNSVGGYAFGLIGFSADGSTLLGEGASVGDPQGTLTWLDAASLAPLAEVHPTHDAGVASRAVSPDWRLIATGGSDGLVRIWDADTGALRQEFSLGGARAAAGVAFVNDRHLAVALDGGDVFVVTLDTDELVGIVRDSLTRGFSAAECERFGFGDDCPTLADLRHPGAVAEPTGLEGEFVVEWTIDELAAVLAAEVPAEYPSVAAARERWTVVGRDVRGPGTHTLRFSGGRWDHTVTSENAEWTCTGTYTVSGDRVEMVPERGDCGLARLLSARFTLDGPQLRLYDLDGRPFDRVLFSAMAWQRLP